MARRNARTYSPVTMDAGGTLGGLIATARRERRMPVAELCERAGITPKTLRDVESGAPTVSIGIVFEVATLLAVPLFGLDPAELSGAHARTRERLALLPRRIRAREVDDDF